MNILKNIEILDLKSSSLGDHLFKNSGTAIAPNTRRIDNCEADQAKHQLKQPEAPNSSTKLPISKDFLKKPGNISRHLWTHIEPWVFARQRYEEKSVAIKKLEWKRDNLFSPVSKTLHDANGKPFRKVVREDLQRQLWDAEYQLRIQSAKEQYNAQKVSCTSLHTDMLTKVVEHFKNESESNVLDCYAANLLPGGVNRTIASKAYQDMLSKTYQGVHPEGFEANIAKKANLVHMSLSTLEGLLRGYGTALFNNWKIQQQTKQVATKTRLDSKKSATTRQERLEQLQGKAVLTDAERNELLSLQVATLWEGNSSSKGGHHRDKRRDSQNGRRQNQRGRSRSRHREQPRSRSRTRSKPRSQSHSRSRSRSQSRSLSRASTRFSDSSQSSFAGSQSSHTSRDRKRKVEFAQPKNGSVHGSGGRSRKRNNKNPYPSNAQHSVKTHRATRSKSPRHRPY